MSKNNFFKEKVISDFISLNPTGIIQLDKNGSFKLNGPPSIIMTPAEISKQNLNNSNAGKFICNKNDQKIENFENYNSENYNIEKKSNIIIYFVIILFLLLIFFFIYKKRKI
jgi:hypothetical protein